MIFLCAQDTERLRRDPPSFTEGIDGSHGVTKRHARSFVRTFAFDRVVAKKRIVVAGRSHRLRSVIVGSMFFLLVVGNTQKRWRPKPKNGL